ncbi:response regulator [Geomonas sp. Red32]|uniref:response regulator n=1 Tax=Geomonas sp. Red32 TaxID=2912856 RepID=UPI00202CB4D4|nr:response regulator [Geomonas sp. Red32]MCM0082407.1 response regulator [Geomonas sp. Red32]
MAKILVVDDSMVARMCHIASIPKDQGHEIAEASDGLSALEAFRAMEPDVTFLDLTMPGMNGLDVLAAIKEDYPNAVVIVCTADIQRQTLEMVEKLGAFGVLSKPCSKEVLQEKLARALEKAEQNRDE